MPFLRLLALAALAVPLAAQDPIPLAGKWRFRLDPQNAGLAAQWQNTLLPAAVRIPATTDQNAVGDRTSGSTPGMLTRAWRYVGPAWYQRDIDIPNAWRNLETDLFLERVLWRSDVWIDGRPAGSRDSTGTPHTYPLGPLSPGRHSLTIRIDNSMIHPIGDRGHLYTEHTQTIWNGMIGRIELQPRSPLRLGLVRLFPNLETRSVTVEAVIPSTGDPAQANLTVSIRDLSTGRELALHSAPVSIPDNVPFRTTVTLRDTPKSWDEFQPALYSAEVTLATRTAFDTRQLTFGFRTIASSNRRLTLNGKKLFLRGNLDNLNFPLTGFPPTDLDSWRSLFRIYKDHGLNAVRFHSWCPPEAAFEAADQMGLYLQVEVLWIDQWMATVHPALGPTAGNPKPLGRNDRTTDAFVRAEMRRILDTYGGHPSFLLFCIGNELGGADFDVLSRWIAGEKRRDPRHFYAASTARAITPSDDYTVTHDIPGIGRSRTHLEPSTDWDYQDTYGRASVPVIAHEIGQWPVYPDWSEIDRYKGVLRARNLEGFREIARRNGIGSMDHELRAASGASSLQVYKDEIESFLRTPDCSGVELLSMQDYSGQGEALVGWLDSFYSSKGLITPAAFRRFYGPTVPLVRFPKYVWLNNESFTAKAEVAHFGPRDILNQRASWRLTGPGGAVVAQGTFAPVSIPIGGLTSLGNISAPLSALTTPARLTLTIQLDGTEFANDWTVAVFPPAASAPAPQGVLVTSDLPAALAALEHGEKVLLIANSLGPKDTTRYAAWLPLYWSATFFPNQNRDTLGAIVRNNHPALAEFPATNYLDWLWYDLCRGARGFVLDSLPESYRPIVQPVSDFHSNHKLGSIFELRTPQNGRLLVSGYDLNVDSTEARQLLRSLTAYMAGPRFAPTQEVQPAFLRRLFETPVP
jgi:hypothetical protein